MSRAQDKGMCSLSSLVHGLHLKSAFLFIYLKALCTTLARTCVLIKTLRTMLAMHGPSCCTGPRCLTSVLIKTLHIRMAQTPLPHDSDAPILLCGSASAYDPGTWHGPATPARQGIQTERGTERHPRRRWLPQLWQKQSDQHAQRATGNVRRHPYFVRVCAVAAQPGHTRELQSV